MIAVEATRSYGIGLTRALHAGRIDRRRDRTTSVTARRGKSEHIEFLGTPLEHGSRAQCPCSTSRPCYDSGHMLIEQEQSRQTERATIGPCSVTNLG